MKNAASGAERRRDLVCPPSRHSPLRVPFAAVNAAEKRPFQRRSWHELAFYLSSHFGEKYMIFRKVTSITRADTLISGSSCGTVSRQDAWEVDNHHGW